MKIERREGSSFYVVSDEIEDSDDVRLASTEAYAEHFATVDSTLFVESAMKHFNRYREDGPQAHSPTGAVSEYWAAHAARERHGVIVALFCNGVLEVRS